MNKINFKNLPDTSTPLNAQNLNLLQDNVEDAIDSITIDLDDEVSTSSTNGIENQAITNYVNDIADTIPSVNTTTTSSNTDTYSCNYINNIIESGSNANGNYVKYADGTMVCYGTKSGTGTLADYWTTFKKIEGITTTFPVAFVSTPSITISSISAQSNNIFSVGIDASSSSSFNALILKPSGSSNQNYAFGWIAVGRWKA